jgi:hypothetical protein
MKLLKQNNCMELNAFLRMLTCPLYSRLSLSMLLPNLRNILMVAKSKLGHCKNASF